MSTLLPRAPFTLADFVTESNRIEGMPPARPHEILVHEALLAARFLTVALVENLVEAIAHAPLRRKPGMDVRVGRHIAPAGGPDIEQRLDVLLHDISTRAANPWWTHLDYETLHPFMDGNGRSGRAIWLWQMGGIVAVPLGFLHTFYYQTLDQTRESGE